MGDGKNIRINVNYWVLGNPNFKIISPLINSHIIMVADLLAKSDCKWNREVIETTFSETDAAHILQIPLSHSAHANYRVWGREASGEFSVRSTRVFFIRLVLFQFFSFWAIVCILFMVLYVLSD